jgi:carboxyl-terminal processing protease
MYHKFETIFGLLSKYYYDKPHLDQSKMIESALKGYVDAIGDPFTTYLTSDETKLFNQEMQGSQEFEGIGAVVTKKSEGIMIEEVIKDSPAYVADLRALDIILEINGSGTQSLGLQEAVQKIRGPKESIVLLKIMRESEKKIFDVSVTRQKINVPSVEAESYSYSGKNFLKLELSIIGDDTKKMLRQVLAQHDLKKTDGIILDLRGNG